MNNEVGELEWGGIFQASGKVIVQCKAEHRYRSPEGTGFERKSGMIQTGDIQLLNAKELVEDDIGVVVEYPWP
jgi:hypothetical protein